MTEKRKPGRPKGSKNKKNNEKVSNTQKSEVTKINEIEQIEDKAEKEVEKVVKKLQPKVKVKKQRDLNELIPVKCIANGGLVYKTSNGLIIQWDNYGDINYVEYKELIHMFSRYKRFFTEPWIIMDIDVLEDLHVMYYYKDILGFLDDIDSLFNKNPNEFKDILTKVPDGVKRLIADRATKLIKDNKIDSLQMVKIIQDVLQIELL